ncbi:MAG TPA: TetR/AcrR family transcriptional regulator [Burkholderiaceae bacterium]|jgi:AcrR family transcriptional regulator
MPIQLSPRKAPRQSRSQATVNAILDATARILVECGIKAASTNAVAERAGVSVGSLYQYFPNKGAMITALHARHGEEMMAVIQRALNQAMDATLEDALAGLIEAAVEAHRVDADLHRVLEQYLGDETWDARHAEYIGVMEERVVAMLARHRDRISAPDLKLAAFMLMTASHELIHAVVLDRPRGVSLKQSTQDIVHMMAAYLTCPRPN